MLKITNTPKIQTNTNYYNAPNFKGNIFTNILKPEDDEDREKRNNVIKIGTLIAITLAAAGAFIKYKGFEKTKEEINKLYSDVYSKIYSSQQTETRVKAALKDFPWEEKISAFSQGDINNVKTLTTLRNLFALDSINESTENLRLPKLISFDKLENNSFRIFADSLFGNSSAKYKPIEYKGNIQDAINQLNDLLNQGNKEQRTIITIINTKGKSFASDIRKSKDSLSAMKEFFQNIGDKKISFVTADKELLSIFKKQDINPEKMNIPYRIKSIPRFVQTY